jgi:hypothetical protein
MFKIFKKKKYTDEELFQALTGKFIHVYQNILKNEITH